MKKEREKQNQKFKKYYPISCVCLDCKREQAEKCVEEKEELR